MAIVFCVRVVVVVFLRCFSFLELLTFNGFFDLFNGGFDFISLIFDLFFFFFNN